MPAFGAPITFRRGMRLAAIFLVFGLPFFAGCSPKHSLADLCTAINAQFTNGTPLRLVVAKLRPPDTVVTTSFLSIPADTNYHKVCVYHFESGDIVISSTGGPPALLDFDKRRFVGAIVWKETK